MNKIMPVVGCFQRRIYLEKYVANLIRPGELEPGIICLNRSTCKKTVVTFT